LEISIFGIGPAVDAQALSAVRGTIGSAVTRGVIDTYITYGYGIEGGSSSCIQLSPYEGSKRLLELESELLQIQPNRETTAYEVKAVAACRRQSTSPAQVSELTNTEWLLEELGGTSVINTPQKPTLRFIDTERIGGQGGCNSYSANFQIDGNRFTVSELIATKRACIEPPAQEQENRYFHALENAQQISLEDPYLLIYSEGLDEPLRFSRLAPDS
jgi:heat shock protein HslJ